MPKSTHLHPRSGSLRLEDFATQQRRREPRTPADRVIDVLPCRAVGEWGFISAELIDCSLHGVGVIMPIPIAVEEQFLLKLHLDTVVMLAYTVRDCIPWEARRWRIGAEFAGFAASAFEGSLETVLASMSRARQADGKG